MTGSVNTVRSGSWAVLRVILILGMISLNLSSHAAYLARSYIIYASAGEGGSISPSGAVKVNKGRDQTFEIIPDEGYEILDVLVDGASVGPVTEYKFNNVYAPHTIHATFRASFAVLDLTIPNDSMKIGDQVPVTISVTDDGGATFALVSGTIGGYPLEGFQRNTATVYLAYFTIKQGGESFADQDNIPVAGLVISNGEKQTVPYELPIIQDGDPLDAALPVISSMAVEGGIRKIGDVVILNIYADGVNYRADPTTTIQGYSLTASNVTFTESGEGNYVLSYTVQEGDPDIVPGSSEIEVSVVLIRPSGNVGLPYSKVDNASQLAVDANAPVVSRMEVLTQESAVGIGGAVRVNIMADGLNYAAAEGTVVNGIPVGSPRMTFTGLSDGLYEISYVVAEEDAPVAAGMLQVSVVPVDPAGNIGETFSILEPNSLEIYTDRPVVVIQGDADICLNESSVLGVYLKGRAPWSFDLSDGTTSTSYKDIALSTLNIDITPVVTTTYQISALTDVNGVVNPEPTEFRVTVNEKTDVEIINLALGYSVDADPVRLEADVPGGVFSGPGTGMNGTTWYFYPAVADTVNSPHTIYYNYINDKGCSSSDSTIVYVAGSMGAILIPSKTVCLKDDPFLVSVFNLSGAIGSFRLLDSFSNPMPGLTDHLDNTATIDPAQLGLDTYTIEFQYMDAGIHYLTQAFSVETVSQPEILNLNEGSYCQSAAPIVLHSNLTNVLFEGPGVTGNAIDGYIFNPGETEPGDVTIICTAFSPNGCTESTGKTVTIVAAPDVSFTMSTACPEEGGEMVSFENQSGGMSLVETWSWDFGDPASGQDNFSNLIHPTHLYQDPGYKTITLVATTPNGCVGTFVLDSIIEGKPTADFTWISNCLSSGPGVKFVNTSNNTSKSPEEITWTFKSGDGNILGEIGSDSPSDTVSYLFEDAGSYLVDLFMMNRSGCSDELTKEIVIRPTIQLDRDGYMESFDASEGLWSIQSENQVESWVWGVPDFTGFVPMAGDRAWFTRLPAGVAGYYENSWIQSPCFDFSDMDRPMIRLDIMRSFVPGMNGAVLQFQDVIEEGWKTVGEQIPGIGWYNSLNIYNRPGGSSTGWGLPVFHPDKEWVTAAHDLDQVTGKPGVAFRIAFASNGELEMKNQGFAFNNVIIAERSKLAVLEHFTDNSYDNSRIADDLIDGVATAHSKDVIDLQYHTNTSGMDIMNINNPFPPSTRSFNYGVPPVPYSVLDGGVSLQQKFDFADLQKSEVEDQLLLATLEIPAFEIDLAVDWQESGLEAHSTVTCLNEGYKGYIQLYLVVFETSVTAYTGNNGDTHFRNVVLDMLPTQGKLLGGNWIKGNSNVSNEIWTYQPYVEDIDELAVAAFVQDRTTFQILQAAVNYKDKTVAVPETVSGITGLRISPNPAQDLLHVNLGARTEHQGSIVLLDMSGKVVLAEQVPAGYQLLQLDIEYLERGMYILQWLESGQVRGVTKVVKPR